MTEREKELEELREKECYCYGCQRWFHYLGIASHRAIHRRKKEDVMIKYSKGDTYLHKFSKLKELEDG